jgi:hypothetical protein
MTPELSAGSFGAATGSDGRRAARVASSSSRALGGGSPPSPSRLGGLPAPGRSQLSMALAQQAR